MSEYFLGLILFAFVGSVIFSFVPPGASKRYVRLLCGLCSVGCIVFPLFELVVDTDKGYFKDLTQIFEASGELGENAVEIYNNSINNVTLENAEETLKNDIIKAFSIKYDAVEVAIVLDKNSDEFYIKRIMVYLYPSGYGADPQKIRDICKSTLGVTCDIIYK